MTTLKNTGLISAFALKMIMAVLMLGDHLAYFLPQFFPFELHFAGRLVAPVFCYLMTVSLYHTRNRGRYIARMATAGLLMLAGSFALTGALGGPGIGNTIFLSLALSAALIDQIEQATSGDGRLLAHLPVIILLIVACFFVEGKLLLPVMAVVFYFLRENKPLMFLTYILAASGVVFLFGFQPYQHLQALAIVPIAMYSGEKGSDTAFAKWFFYIFYPLHIWILYIIRHLLFFAH